MKNNPVLVAGAGPVGLSAALGLALSGVPVRIIDRLATPVNQSRAAILHARTLEHFARLGIVDEFLLQGVKVHGAAVYGPGNVLLIRPSLDHLPSPFPFMLGLEQFKTEAILTDLLQKAGVEIERGVELLDFQDSGDLVSARLRHADGTETPEDFAYLIGADGARSTVRAGLGLTLEGETLDATWITADVKIRWDRDPGEAIGFLAEDGVAFIAPMNDNRWRVVVTHSKMTREEAEKATLQDVQNLVAKRFAVNLALYDSVWISAFGVNSRMAPAMSRGRVFLAGDAAHIHSPVGGQGMNTGIQDALNLVWKITLVSNGAARPQLLESYNAERHYNAKRLLSRIGSATKMVALRNPVAIGIRNKVIHLLAHLGAARIMPNAASMLDVGYPESPIVGESHTSWLARGPRAGERAPCAEGLLVANQTEPQDLFSLWSGDNRHQLLVFSKDAPFPESPLYKITQIVKTGAPAEGRVIDPDGHAHHAYAADRDGAYYLIRPDGIIAFRSGESDPAALAAYLTKL